MVLQNRDRHREYGFRVDAESILFQLKNQAICYVF